MNDTELIREIETEYSNTAGLVVQKNGKLIYEKYFDGHKETDKINIFSVTKSITSILIGMAIDQGYIKSINQKVLDFFPYYDIKRGNILTMTAPYKYKERIPLRLPLVEPQL